MRTALKVDTDYFYLNNTEQFNFINIPKLMVVGKDFCELSITSKILYGLLLDRISIASKNKWLDDEGKVYIIYRLEEIQDDMGVSKRKAGECLNELENIGLIKKRKGGFGEPSKIYIKNFAKQK